MNKYVVVRPFVDLQDSHYRYNVGDVYPRGGYTPDGARVEELSGANNKIGAAVIKQVETKPAKAENPNGAKPAATKKPATKKSTGARKGKTQQRPATKKATPKKQVQENAAKEDNINE